VIALVLRRPELAALAAPFGLLVVISLATAAPPELDVRLRLDRTQAVEGDQVSVELALTARRSIAHAHVAVDLAGELQADGPRDRWLDDVRSGERRHADLRLGCSRWGAYRLGPVRVRTVDRFELIAHRAVFDSEATLRVYPTIEHLRSIVAPRETQPHAGNLVSRRKGEGVEFADIRPFVPGDRVRSINWRASSRRNELLVNDRHPEQNSDVILFLDSFSELRRDGRSTLDLTVRAAASLAAGYLDRRDRVGIVGFGGTVRWLLPSTGTPQLYRIVLSYAWKDIDVVPSRTLPPQALVIALSPLLDERTVNALVDLRRRGFDLVVVDLSPLSFTQPARGRVGDLAYRLWGLQREALRYRYEDLGVPVVEWDGSGPLQTAIEEVRAFRRHAALARL
jgi:uncharacterized protein (DUF58 family)